MHSHIQADTLILVLCLHNLVLIYEFWGSPLAGSMYSLGHAPFDLYGMYGDCVRLISTTKRRLYFLHCIVKFFSRSHLHIGPTVLQALRANLIKIVAFFLHIPEFFLECHQNVYHQHFAVDNFIIINLDGNSYWKKE